MTKENLVTAPVGTELDEAERILARHRIEKLPGGGRRRASSSGLITVKDIFKRREHPDANKDQHGRLRVAAAVGAAPDAPVRAPRRWSAPGVDVLVVDSAHGHSEGVLQTVDAAARGLPRRAARGRQRRDRGRRPRAGAPGGRRGEGRASGPAASAPPGSSPGVGIPQVTAIIDAVARRRRGPGHRRRRHQVLGRRRSRRSRPAPPP